MMTHTHTGSERPNWASHAGRPITTTGSERPICKHGRSLTDQTPGVPATNQCGHDTIPRRESSSVPFPILHLSYPYDARDNRLTMDRSDVGISKYSYDETSQLVKAELPWNGTQNYVYT